MARLKSGIFGPISGKIGSIIGGIWKGIPYIKEVKQKPGKTKRSPAQLANEAKFRFINNWVNPLHPFFVVGFYNLAVGRTAISAGFSAAYHDVFSGTYPELTINLSQLKISTGKLPIVKNPAIKFTNPNTVKLTWAKNMVKGTQFNDQIMVALFNPDEGICDGIIGGVIRSAEEHVIELGEESVGKPLHVYLGVFSLDRNKISNSQYLGLISPTL